MTDTFIQKEELDTLISSDNKTIYHAPFLWLAGYPNYDPKKWRLTTYSKAMISSGAWKEIPDWYKPQLSGRYENEK